MLEDRDAGTADPGAGVQPGAALAVDERQGGPPQLAAQAASADVGVHADADAGGVGVVAPREVGGGLADDPVAVAGDPQGAHRPRVGAELQRGQQVGPGLRREVQAVRPIARGEHLGEGVGGVQVEVQRVDALEVHRAIQRHRRRDG